jgi:hypothetical protein
LSTLSPEHKKKWPEHLPLVVAYYNATPHATTGFSPFYLMFGRTCKLPIDFLLGAEDDYNTNWVQDHTARLKSAHEVAGRNMQGNCERRKKNYDHKAKDWSLPVGSRVYTLNHNQLGRNKIGDHYCDEVYIILDRLGDVYSVKRADGTGKVRRLSRKELRAAPRQEEQRAETPAKTSPQSVLDPEECQPVSSHHKPQPGMVRQDSQPQSSLDEDSDEEYQIAITSQPLRRSRRRGAGTHPNPYNLPRSVLR